jgi:putative endonuclease
MAQGYHVYILASGRNGTLYIGVTSNLSARIWQHRNGTADGFTMRYKVDRLVHVEEFADVREAIAREKALKKWRPPGSWTSSNGAIRDGSTCSKS